MTIRRDTAMAASGTAPWPSAPENESPVAELAPSPAAGTVKLNFNVSLSVAQEVRALAKDLDLTMTQLFRYAFGILKIAAQEAKKKRKLVIADENGHPLREIVLPGVGG
jgi:hypothetical protein